MIVRGTPGRAAPRREHDSRPAPPPQHGAGHRLVEFTPASRRGREGQLDGLRSRSCRPAPRRGGRARSILHLVRGPGASFGGAASRDPRRVEAGAVREASRSCRSRQLAIDPRAARLGCSNSPAPTPPPKAETRSRPDLINTQTCSGGGRCAWTGSAAGEPRPQREMSLPPHTPPASRPHRRTRSGERQPDRVAARWCQAVTTRGSAFHALEDRQVPRNLLRIVAGAKQRRDAALRPRCATSRASHDAR